MSICCCGVLNYDMTQAPLPETTNLLDLLKKHLSIAEKFTKEKYIKEVEKSVKAYDAQEEVSVATTPSGKQLTEAISRRYEFPSFLVFTNTESFKAALGEKMPGIIVKAQGDDDENKKQAIEAAYEYIKNKLDLESFMEEARHWFVLTGFCSAYTSYHSEGIDVPATDEMGQPVLNPDGTPVTNFVYTYNDPIIKLMEPDQAFYSPESKFSIKGDRVPYCFYKKLMNVDEIEQIYGFKPEVDTQVEVEGLNKKDEYGDELDRASLYCYFGKLPSNVAEEVPGWDTNSDYYVLLTKQKILYVEKLREKNVRLAKWYGNPTAFFGFGTGKIGRPLQLEKSIRRGQEVRMADLAAFPKYSIPSGVDINEADLLDPRALTLFRRPAGQGNEVQILAPPQISQGVGNAIARVDTDAQQAFGLLDISQGSQSASVVKTATGQSIFAQAAERRVSIAQKQLMNFYKQIVIDLLKLAQQNWDEEKVITVLDADGNPTQKSIKPEDLQGVNFDTDIEIDLESTSSNKDLIRQQMVSLYDKVKDDPLANREQILKDLMRIGFDQKNPDRYIRKSPLTPGMALTGQDGQQYVVDDSGQVVPAQDMANTRAPSGDTAPAGDLSAVMGGAQ